MTDFYPGMRVRVTAKGSLREGHEATITRIAPGGPHAAFCPIAVEFSDSRPSAYGADELEPA